MKATKTVGEHSFPTVSISWSINPNLNTLEVLVTLMFYKYLLTVYSNIPGNGRLWCCDVSHVTKLQHYVTPLPVAHREIDWNVLIFVHSDINYSKFCLNQMSTCTDLDRLIQEYKQKWKRNAQTLNNIHFNHWMPNKKKYVHFVTLFHPGSVLGCITKQLCV